MSEQSEQLPTQVLQELFDFFGTEMVLVWKLSQFWIGKNIAKPQNWNKFLTSKLCLLAETFFSLKVCLSLKVSNFAGLIWELFFGLKRDW